MISSFAWLFGFLIYSVVKLLRRAWNRGYKFQLTLALAYIVFCIIFVIMFKLIVGG